MSTSAQARCAAMPSAACLSNPVAALISVPIQFNHDRDIGPARDGTRTQINIQPVVPFSLNTDWNIISPTAGGLIWGVGPVLLLPTGTNDLLTTNKWGAGPAGVVIRQQGRWTVGALANHIWSFAGNSSRADVNATFLQPFVTYTTPTATTFSLNSESTYDWTGRQWTVPISTGVSQMLRLGGQLVQVGAVARYWADGPQQAPHDWDLRLSFTLLFPR